MTGTRRATLSSYVHSTTIHWIASSLALLVLTVVKGVQRGFPFGGGLGVSPSYKKIPQDWGIRGLIETISAISLNI
jgi:hypothetical protein